MPSIISAGTTSGTALNFSGDTSGVLTVQGVTMGNGGVGNGNATRFKNRIINGDMRIDQRNNGASVTPTNQQYLLDRWLAGLTQSSKFTVQQDAGAVTPPVGFTDYLGCISTSAYSVPSGDTFFIQQNIEGLNISDLAWGTANAKTVTLSFWVRSSLTGTFGGNLTNNGTTRSYPISYSIPVANTWTQISITIAGDTTGTWLVTNGIGLKVTFSLGTGSSLSNTAGAWVAGNFLSSTGATSVVGTNGATFYVTGVQLEVGSSATGFEYVDYTTQLAMCQRYYYKWLNDSGDRVFPFAMQSYTSANAFGKLFDLPVTMRATPTCSTSGTFTAMSAGGGTQTAFTSTTITSATKNTIATGDWTGSSGMTAGQAQPVSVPNNAFVQASAEL